VFDDLPAVALAAGVPEAAFACSLAALDASFPDVWAPAFKANANTQAAKIV
jgi:hypothetical protein